MNYMLCELYLKRAVIKNTNKLARGAQWLSLRHGLCSPACHSPQHCLLFPHIEAKHQVPLSIALPSMFLTPCSFSSFILHLFHPRGN